ncbi:hypothetical protein IE077_004412 [Cardiosporidium cionae]|uniref:NF-kappa-B-activating protein C-terminal domain-containing protein n=1 Tax=Cardiosporidium cionae TaxID=476202 RepID=A0ABQ7JAC8_9APIC|nr:hypothetical protein IE077_004412 [Cardiosporidium cionae]|eukprot:KAF8820893.1 hypothetical protein IE077_004412 [Cardiosporidium cionae]
MNFSQHHKSTKRARHTSSRSKKKHSRKRSPSTSSTSEESYAGEHSSNSGSPIKEERSSSSEVGDTMPPPFPSSAPPPPPASLPPPIPLPQNDSESSEEDLPGPQPLDITVKLSNKIVDYGGALRPGEGEAIAQYVQEGKRIPRRGEVGLTADEIESYETLGYVMSGSRHRRMNAIRIRKENQVYSAEEQRALAMYNYEERANREGTLITDLREMLKKQNETIFSETLEEQFASAGNQKKFV